MPFKNDSYPLNKGEHISVRSPHRDALRLLYIFYAGAEIQSPDDDGCKLVFKGNTKLYAYDFWMRYPDYLADELLDLFDRTNDKKYLDAASKIFADDEPSIRKFPMIRYRFGAYEQVDDALAILRSCGLIKIGGRKKVAQVFETNFYLLPIAEQVTQDIIVEYPALEWYPNRAKLVAEVAARRGGAALKARQYEKIEYAETTLGKVIPAVTDRVKERLEFHITKKAAG
ncbi:hypothetical protein Pan241w_58080 [Gimesia alba]|uniref:Uncharacterized protein n=2 Tax=Gimesia alba TaxID=2527973 RepID=A0A517RP70_9PLAN|nr:hypothetical protein Pan241w_58080 [Gimesia alba]